LIRGWLEEDRPCVRAEVVIPARDAAGGVRTHTAFIDFHIDTGSDVTVLAHDDFSGVLGLSFAQTEPGIPSFGVGAGVLTRAIDGFVFFNDEAGGRAVARITFTVLADDSAGASRMHSLLGLDVLLLGRLTLDRTGVTLDLPVVPPGR
jgi:hypothetical protein